MSKTLCIFGKTPGISIAELESLYGADSIEKVLNGSALFNIEAPAIDFSRLGGTIKLCKVLSYIEPANWKDLEKYLLQTIPEHLHYLPEGKLKLGLSVFGMNIEVKQINITALKLKSAIQKAGRSVRIVPNKETFLNSAQVLHNKLTSELGWELVIVKDGSRIILAQNTSEQDIDSYSMRDFGRPKRDARVGMLPPKLAQSIINIATGNLDSDTSATILDPFCGTGVILQEAALMGYDAYGTDIEQKMVDYSKANLDWMGEKFSHPPFSYYLDQADATDYKWSHEFNHVASEVYLGQPFSALPPREKLEQVRQNCDTIISKFLRNLASQTPAGLRLCLAVPSWKTKNGFLHLKTLDNLADLGYNRVSFKHVLDKDLLYHREDQVVARELLVLKRK